MKFEVGDLEIGDMVFIKSKPHSNFVLSYNKLFNPPAGGGIIAVDERVWVILNIMKTTQDTYVQVVNSECDIYFVNSLILKRILR